MLFIFLLLIHFTLAHSLVIDCVDTPSSFSNSLWKLNAPIKTHTFNGSQVIGVQGTDTKIAKDVYATAIIPTQYKSIYLYLEYLNESPRRISIQPSQSSGIDLLPGTLAEWTNTFQQISFTNSNEIKLTMLLKVGQNVYFRKMVLSTRTLDSASQNNSCNELLHPAMNVVSTPKSVVGSTRKPTRSCTNDAGVQSCSVCPECACVCNCNCPKDC
ncbi:unnamed protein product [Orchesella dallaii]|uniref:Uncharacterized protein n=1 Tax=Orchesella dallaii TaxID=48710 RepID=A0ABP1QWV5_9HEXA